MLADGPPLNIIEHPVFKDFKQLVRTIRAETVDPKKKHHDVYIQVEFDGDLRVLSFRETIDACFYVGEASNAAKRAANHFINSTATIPSFTTKSMVGFVYAFRTPVFTFRRSFRTESWKDCIQMVAKKSSLSR